MPVCRIWKIIRVLLGWFGPELPPLSASATFIPLRWPSAPHMPRRRSYSGRIPFIFSNKVGLMFAFLCWLISRCHQLFQSWCVWAWIQMPKWPVKHFLRTWTWPFRHELNQSHPGDIHIFNSISYSRWLNFSVIHISFILREIQNSSNYHCSVPYISTTAGLARKPAHWKKRFSCSTPHQSPYSSKRYVCSRIEREVYNTSLYVNKFHWWRAIMFATAQHTQSLVVNRGGNSWTREKKRSQMTCLQSFLDQACSTMETIQKERETF